MLQVDTIRFTRIPSLDLLQDAAAGSNELVTPGTLRLASGITESVFDLVFYNGDTWVSTTEGGGGGGGGVSTHANLNGLSADDHPQYILVDGTRGFTATVSGIEPTQDYELATKEYVDNNSGSGGFSDPMTTRGDIIFRNASNSTDRLPIGSSRKVLTSDGTDVSWSNPAADVIIPVTVAGGVYVIDGNSQDIIRLQPNMVVRFDVSDSSNSSHSFALSTAAEGPSYTTGVTDTGSDGTSYSSLL